MDHLDPGSAYYKLSYTVMYATQRPLYSFRPEGTTVATPDLAAGAPQVSDGGRRVTVRIKRGIRLARPGWSQLRARCLAEARRLLGPTAEADDAVQEAFLRGWRNRARCRTPEKPLPWLLAITRNDALRIRGRSAGRPHEEMPEEDPDSGADPEVKSAPLRVDLFRALAELPEPDRRLLQMRYGEDLTQASVADRLGIPEGTVKVRLHRLRARLRVALKE